MNYQINDTGTREARMATLAADVASRDERLADLAARLEAGGLNLLPEWQLGRAARDEVQIRLWRLSHGLKEVPNPPNDQEIELDEIQIQIPDDAEIADIHADVARERERASFASHTSTTSATRRSSSSARAGIPTSCELRPTSSSWRRSGSAT